jgi:hypothetical protein
MRLSVTDPSTKPALILRPTQASPLDGLLCCATCARGLSTAPIPHKDTARVQQVAQVGHHAAPEALKICRRAAALVGFSFKVRVAYM